MEKVLHILLTRKPKYDNNSSEIDQRQKWTGNLYIFSYEIFNILLHSYIYMT